MGALLILISAAGFGSMAIFAKLAYAADANVPTVLAARFVLASLLVWAGLALAGGARPLPPRDGLPLLGLGGIGYFSQSFTFFLSLQYLDASTAALVLYTYPAMVVLLGFVLGIERPARRHVGALLLASLGCLLVLGRPGGVPDARGVALVLVSAAIYSGYILVGSRLTGRAPALLTSAHVLTGAAISFTAFGLGSGQVDLDLALAGWAAIGGIAVFSTVVAVAAFLAGLDRVGPSRAAILSTAEPVVTVALAAVVLGEALVPLQLLGGLLILAAALLARGPAAVPPRPALEELARTPSAGR